MLGEGVRFAHRAPGLVIHPNTRGNNVHFYLGVTLGLAYPWKPLSEIESISGGGYFIDIQDDVILCAGCKVLSKGKLVVGKGHWHSSDYFSAHKSATYANYYPLL